MAEPSPSEAIVSLYERHAQGWFEDRGTILHERAWLDRFAEPLAPEAAILDIGCGTGDPIARYLLGRGFALTGIDSSPSLIAMAAERLPAAEWIVADMRSLDLYRRFDGLIAWHSFFHLTPDDQRVMFPRFAGHAAPGATLMFTGGPQHGEAIGAWRGEPLYHGSLDPAEYRDLLDDNGFDLLDQHLGDPDCGGAYIWLARKRA